ncbi:MAG: sulfotransferase [Candidatus Omnitrophica bacterium]|nr:sulfotransferase [Candidatus Omnitrophota bacterium]
MAYNRLDKALLQMGFHSLPGQEMLSYMEDVFLSRSLRPLTIRQPVFISSLARSGTTLLLQLLMKTGIFAAQTYREMPFVMCPVLWKNLASRFYLKGESKERAHKDGVEVSYDSEEAFEEILWRHFFKKKYTKYSLECFFADETHEEFEGFFRNHIRKILLLNQTKDRTGLRYLSKNNANIGRLPYLNRVFPEAVFVVPVRHPVPHVRSLRTQHASFSRMQKDDPFVKKYMDYLGHFEFGMSFKRIDFFQQYRKVDSGWALDDENFWIHYWCDSMRYLKALKEKLDNIVIVKYERLCADPQKELENVFDRLDLPASKIAQIASFVRMEDKRFPVPSAYTEAKELYDAMG